MTDTYGLNGCNYERIQVCLSQWVRPRRWALQVVVAETVSSCGWFSGLLGIFWFSRCDDSGVGCYSIFPWSKVTFM